MSEMNPLDRMRREEALGEFRSALAQFVSVCEEGYLGKLFTTIYPTNAFHLARLPEPARSLMIAMIVNYGTILDLTKEETSNAGDQPPPVM
jgi:hypothetical protein